MGKASRLKHARRQLREGPQGGGSPQHSAPANVSKTPHAPTEDAAGKALLATLTGEPIQPVRLCWSIASRAKVERALQRLSCMNRDPDAEDCWEWLFGAEAAQLDIGGGYHAVPENRRPIILGRLRFADDGTMTLETGSTERAVAAAQFFAVRLGKLCQLARCRVVNRLFAAEADRMPSTKELMKSLDEDVTLIDPAKNEERLRKDIQRLKEAGVADIMGAIMQRDLESNEDVPAVEDFPADPDDGKDFPHLRSALTFRRLRAMEHWRGNTHMTLVRVIMQATGMLPAS